MKKVLITGSTGFCGTYLSRQLLASKKYKVYGSHFPGSRVPKEVPSIPLDITREAQVTDVLKRLQPDIICHLAAQSSARYSAERLDQTYRVNLQGTLNLADAVRKWIPKTRFFYTSSVHVYGQVLRTGKKVTEKSQLHPETHYGISKALSEMACLDLHKKFGLDVVIARAVNFFGPGQSPELVFSDWCRQIALIEAKRQAPFIEVGNLSLRRDFLYIQDAVEVYEKLLQKAKPGEIYNVSSSKSLPLQTYLDFLTSIAKVPIRIQPVPARFRKDDAPAVRINSAKIRALGWKPRFSIKESLKLVLQDWRARIASE